MFIISINNIILHYLILIFFLNVIMSTDIELNTVLINDNIYDLNAFYIITKISFTIKETPNNYLFGIFEGSNDTSFSDSLPLTMIKENDLKNVGSKDIAINIPNSYRYIRYIL